MAQTAFHLSFPPLQRYALMYVCLLKYKRLLISLLGGASGDQEPQSAIQRGSTFGFQPGRHGDIRQPHCHLQQVVLPVLQSCKGCDQQDSAEEARAQNL